MKLEELDICLTDKCNLYCDFCSVQAHEKADEISFTKIKEIIDQSIEYGLEELHLTGGEPTLRDDLEDIISYSTSKKLNVRLITNGTLLNEERLNQLRKCGLKSIMISLDGLTAYHDSIRGCGTYERTMATIVNALSLGMLVRVNSVAWMNNKDEILQLADLMNKLGVHVYSIFLGSPLGYAKKHKENILTTDMWREFYQSLRNVTFYQKYKTKIVMEKGFLYPDEEFDLDMLQGRGRGCYKITNYCDYLLVRSNGNVYPCVFFSNEALPIGNIYENSLMDILCSFKHNEFYENIGKYPSECMSCDKVYLCKGGCRGYAKIYNDDWMARDPRCDQHVSSGIIPLCPIIKHNLNEDRLGGSSEQVLRKQ